MPKVEILANTGKDEIRVAMLEDGKLSEFFCERRNSRDQFLVGNIYCGKVANVLAGMEAAFIDIGHEKNAYLYITDILPQDRGKSIERILKKDQRVMAQVIKDTIGTKGMKITLNISLTGRHLILAPFSRQQHISHQIKDSAERKRLSKALSDALPSQMGSIIRTEAGTASPDEIRNEARYLLHQWEMINKKFERADRPSVLQKEVDMPLYIARDLLGDNVSVYMVDSPGIFREVKDYVEKIAPDLKNRVVLYDKKMPIFDAFGIENELTKMRQSHIPLKSGGMIIIQESESITMIDVNTARFVGATTQEETVTQTNMEAANEIARQLRLRNIGGIVVIDFIDMKQEFNRKRILESFKDALKYDRAKVKIHPITGLGLIEMTRERKRESNLVFLTESCNECQGSGRVLSRETIFLKVSREINGLLQGHGVNMIRVLLAPHTAKYFKEHLSRMEAGLSVKPSKLLVQDEVGMRSEDYKIVLE
ncbi:Rne/Rng family ribonuclease [Elusimicrobiota bacterium]